MAEGLQKRQVPRCPPGEYRAAELADMYKVREAERQRTFERRRGLFYTAAGASLAGLLVLGLSLWVMFSPHFPSNVRVGSALGVFFGVLVPGILWGRAWVQW